MTTRIEVPGTGGGGGGAPTNAEYLVGALDATLTNERLVTDTSTVAWDLATGGQAKANVPDGSITYAKIQDVSTNSILIGRGASGVGPVEEITLGTNLSITGTTLNASSGAGASWTEDEINFGTEPVWEKSFIVNDAASLTTSVITIVQSGKTATGREDGDAEWDVVNYSAKPDNGFFLVYAMATPGPIVGARKFQYTVA